MRERARARGRSQRPGSISIRATSIILCAVVGPASMAEPPLLRAMIRCARSTDFPPSLLPLLMLCSSITCSFERFSHSRVRDDVPSVTLNWRHVPAAQKTMTPVSKLEGSPSGGPARFQSSS